MNEGRKFQRENVSALSAMYEQLSIDLEIQKVICQPWSVFVDYDDERMGVELTEPKLSTYTALCDELPTPLVWRTPVGIKFYAGEDTVDGRYFEASVIRLDRKDSGTPNCEKTDPTTIQGACNFAIDENWVIHYFWQLDFSELTDF